MCSSLAAVVLASPTPSITINTPSHTAAAGHAVDLSQAHHRPHLNSAASRLGRNNRRTSYLANRSSAVDQTSWTKMDLPRKQNSSPLPQKSQRIYDRSHMYSRSCSNNPDGCYANAVESNMDCWLDAAAQQSNHYTPPQQRQNTLLINARQRKPVLSSAAYSQRSGPIKANYMCEHNVAVVCFSDVVSPPFSDKKHSAVLTPPAAYWIQRQAKSFDDRNSFQPSSASYLPPTSRRSHQEQPQYSIKHRSKSQTAARKQLLLRQETLQLLQNPSQSSEVSRECQGLWQARQHLAAIKQTIPMRVQHLQQYHQHQPTTQMSTDLSTEPCSLASTSLSLDSNCSNAYDPCPTSELAATTTTSAEFKRQKYKSLFTQRRSSRGSVFPTKPAVDSPSSFDSLASAGPTGDYNKYGHTVAASNLQRLASSLDSSRSENSGHAWRDQQQKSADVSNFTRKSGSSRTLSPTPIDPFSSSQQLSIQQPYNTHSATSRRINNTSLAPFANKRSGGGSRTPISRSYPAHQRDYSVDCKSDSLFRQFSQLEPPPPSSPALVRTASERRNNQSTNPLTSSYFWLSTESSQCAPGAAANKNYYNYF